MDNYLLINLFNLKKNKLIINPKGVDNNSSLMDNISLLEDESNYKKISRSHKCIFCNKKNITTGYFKFKNIVWDDSLQHYMKEHNVNIPIKFKSFINKFNKMEYIEFKKQNIITKDTKSQNIVGPQKITVLKFKSYGKQKIKLNRNQLNIMDALLYHGSAKDIYQYKNKFYYSEHFGLFDFDHNKLDSIVIDANTDRIDEKDDSILLPTTNRKDLQDFEYIFHTHPPENNKPGGRVKDGILYEFPSINDIFHFIYYHNIGNVNGSLVNTCEGLYIIKTINLTKKKVNISATIEKKLNKIIYLVQNEAIKKYGTTFSDNIFYSKIAQNISYIRKINKILKLNNIIIDYRPRIKNKKEKWVLPLITLDVHVVEIV